MTLTLDERVVDPTTGEVTHDRAEEAAGEADDGSGRSHVPRLDDGQVVCLVAAAERLSRMAAAVRGQAALELFHRWTAASPTWPVPVGGSGVTPEQAARAERLRAMIRDNSTIRDGDVWDAEDLAASCVDAEISAACGVSQ
jgi:hypothetical protein